VGPNANDYHLQPGSAVDVGTDAGVYLDFDGETRLMGAGLDVTS